VSASLSAFRRWIDRRRGIVARTNTGKPMRDADYQALADVAECGYDVEHLIGKPSKDVSELRRHTRGE
jgi:hypothetical protein